MLYSLTLHATVRASYRAGRVRLDMALYSESFYRASDAVFYPFNSMRNRALLMAETEVRLPVGVGNSLLHTDLMCSGGTRRRSVPCSDRLLLALASSGSERTLVLCLKQMGPDYGRSAPCLHHPPAPSLLRCHASDVDAMRCNAGGAADRHRLPAQPGAEGPRGPIMEAVRAGKAVIIAAFDTSAKGEAGRVDALAATAGTIVSGKPIHGKSAGASQCLYLSGHMGIKTRVAMHSYQLAICNGRPDTKNASPACR